MIGSVGSTISSLRRANHRVSTEGGRPFTLIAASCLHPTGALRYPRGALRYPRGALRYPRGALRYPRGALRSISVFTRTSLELLIRHFPSIVSYVSCSYPKPCRDLFG